MRRTRSGRTLVHISADAQPGEVDAVPDDVDFRVHDRVALEEIDLYADVLGAVAASDRPLTADELDRVLGVLPIQLCGSG
jgi:hypothetical protein